MPLRLASKAWLWPAPQREGWRLIATVGPKRIGQKSRPGHPRTLPRTLITTCRVCITQTSRHRTHKASMQPEWHRHCPESSPGPEAKNHRTGPSYFEKFQDQVISDLDKFYCGLRRVLSLLSPARRLWLGRGGEGKGPPITESQFEPD